MPQDDPLGILTAPPQGGNDPLGILKKKDGGQPSLNGAVISNVVSNSPAPSSSPQQNQPTQPKYVVHADGTTSDYSIPSIAQGIQNQQQNSGGSTKVPHPVVAPSSVDIAAKKASVKADNEIAIDNTVKKIVAQKGEYGATGANPVFEKEKLRMQLQNGNVSVGYDKDGNLGLKQQDVGGITGFVGSFMKTRDDANKEAADADLFTNGLNNTERIAFLKNKQQKESASPFIDTKQSFGSTVGKLTGSLEQPLENLGKGAIAGAATVAAAPTTMGASLEGLPLALGIAMGNKDAFNMGYSSEVQRAFGAIKKANHNISDIDAMNEAEKQGNVGGSVGLATNIALMGNSVENGGGIAKEAISDGAKDIIGKAVAGTAKMAAIPAVGQAAIEEAGNIGGVKTSQSDVLNDAVQSFKNNLTPAVVLHLIGAGAAGLTSLPKPVENSLKLAATELPTEQVKATLEGGEKTGFYPAGTAELVTHDINNFKEATDKIPSEIPDEKKAEIAPLIQNKQALIEEQKTKDSSFKDSYQEKIDNVDNQIKQIINKPTEEDVNNNSSQLNQTPNEQSSKEANASSEGRQEVNQNEETAPTNNDAISSSKSSDAKKIYREVNKIDEPTNAKSAALQYIAGGGKIHPDSVNEITGTSESQKLNTSSVDKKSAEVKDRDYVDKNAPKIDDVTHKIWDNLPEHLQDKMSTQDIKNELQDVVKTHNKRLSAANEYVDKYGLENNLTKQEQDFYDQHYPKENGSLEKWLEDESGKIYENDEHFSKDNDINHLIDNYESDNKKENTKSTTTDKKTNSSPTSKGNSSIENKGFEEEPASDKIEPNETFRTLDYGEHKGEPESKEKQDQIKQEIIDDKPVGNTGEKFSDFIKRVVPKFKDLIDKEPNNTTVVTHSSVIKALDVWEDMGRPDIESMTDKQKQKFAEKYVKEDIEKEGGVSTFKGEGDNVIHAIRHGETEDNKMSEFREDNTKLTPKGEGQAAKAGQELNKITDGDVPKIISSDLPRAIHTSNIISEQLKPNEDATTGENTGAKLTDKSSQSNDSNTGSVEPPATGSTDASNEEGKPKTVGVSHDALTKLANKLGLEEPKRGEFLSPKDQVARGRELLKGGADPEQIGKYFQADGKVSADNISVVRAHLENLTKEADQALEKFGKNSEEYKTAKKAIQDWNDKVAKPMGTSAGAALASLQGETDLDTGSFVSMERKYNALTGRDFTPEQEAKAKELTGKVQELEAKVTDLTNKLSDAINNAVKEEKDNPKSIKEKAKSVADAIRKGKLSRPDSFSAATPASLVWDGAIEATAKTIEIGGTIAQAISDGIDHIKASKWYQNLESTKQKAAEKSFTEHLEEQLKNKDVLTRFVDKKDGKFTTDEAKSIWDYAKKTYLDKGVKYEDMVKNVSYDLNLTSDQIQKAVATPKGAREISDEMYRAQHNRDLAVRKATDYVNHAADPKWVKALKAIPNGFFALKTFGHGTVGFITHAGTNIFKPDAWHAYWPNAIKQFDFAFGGMGKEGLARYQRAMENLKNDPQFTFWQRAGLAVDPKESYEEYQGIGRWMGKIGLAGERGFNALKIYRLERAKGIYDALPDGQKADPNTAKVIAELVNHESGTTEAKPFKGANTAFFAPKLEISRWQRLVTDPATAIKTVANWKDATPSEKAQATRVAKNAAQLAATYMTALAANSGLLAVTGSKQKVNYTDPTKSDFLKFKFGNDKTLDVSGGMLSTFDFIAGMIGAATLPKNDLPRGEQRSDVMAKDVWRYGTGKLSPFAGTAKDFATQKDFSGNTMPFSSDKPSKGGHKLTWTEYVENEQTPIPVAEFIKTLHEKGVNESQTSAIIKAAIAATVVGGTGAHIGNSPKVKESKFGGGGAGGKY